jgi:diguanylate cyclase (GGDEF)-like protein/PAS domain S-box-containing protein
VADKKILRLLIVDDSPDDAELATSALRKSNFMLKTQRVQDLASLQAAIEKSAWDMVLSEMTSPHFSAAMVLETFKRAKRDLALVVFARVIKEDDVVAIMRAGALDVIRKDEPFRLGPVIERELRVAEERREWHATAQKMNELEGKHRAVVESTREAIGYCQDGMHIDANPAYLELFGYTKGDLEGLPVTNLIDKTDQTRFKDFLRKVSKEAQEFLSVKKDGTRTHVELMVSAVTFNGEPCTQVMAADISKRKAAESRLQYLNRHDPLTGLYNRHHFLQSLDVALDEVRKGGAARGLIYLDLNQIKGINEQFGHAAGDRILLKVARVFREKLGDDALLARFGGDEFTVLLQQTDELEARKAAEDLCATLKQTSFNEGGKTLTLDCNFGVSMIDKKVENVQKLLSDTYHAAQSTRAPASASAPSAAPAPKQPPAPAPASLITSAPPSPTTAADIPALNEPMTPPPAAAPPKSAPKRAVAKSGASNPWVEKIETALEKNSFELVYQPIVNLHGEPAEYFEVLVRLPGEDGNSISAGQFMPAAEEAGLAIAIDQWVTQNAIEALRELHREDRRATFFINVCPASFREPELIIQTQKLLFASNLKPKYISFEADEEAILSHPAEARAFLMAVKKLGCRFTVDNFGNNMSNLNQLRDLPIDCLKIAGIHIQNLAGDPVAQASLKALIHVAQALEKKIIAKSVERAEDLAVLWNLSVDYVQGHYFQEANSQLNYEFSSEETVSAAPASPQWANSKR